MAEDSERKSAELNDVKELAIATWKVATVVEERCVGPPEAKSSNGAGRFACGGAQRNGTYGCAFCEGHEATAHLLSVAERLRQSKESHEHSLPWAAKATWPNAEEWLHGGVGRDLPTKRRWLAQTPQG